MYHNNKWRWSIFCAAVWLSLYAMSLAAASRGVNRAVANRAAIKRAANHVAKKRAVNRTARRTVADRTTNPVSDSQYLATHPGLPQVVLISIPKSGTTLMRKLITELTDKVEAGRSYCPELYLVQPKDFARVIQLPAHKYWSTHLFYNPNYADALKKEKIACFFIYRDPRDQIVSFMYYMIKFQNLWTGVQGHTHDEIITDLIETCAFQRNSPPARGINDLYRSYLSWLKEPHVLAIRFEDIVGKKGGGSDEAQLTVIHAIAHHLGLDLPDTKIHEIAEKLFGGTETFRKGQIGSWKEHFTEKHKKRFKELAGQLLIDLGYESGFDW